MIRIKNGENTLFWTEIHLALNLGIYPKVWSILNLYIIARPVIITYLMKLRNIYVSIRKQDVDIY